MTPTKVIAATIAVGVATWLMVVTFLAPLGFPFRRTTVNGVEVEKRAFGAVVTDVVRQVEANSSRKIRILFAPDVVASYTREKNGGVFGNPSVEGNAVDALLIACADFRCTFKYVDEDTILFYRASWN